MADALISALVQTILENLNSVVVGEFEIASDLKTKLDNLKSKLSTIQAVLEDAERKQGRSKPVEAWLGKLKEVAYDADDLLDEFAAKALRRKARKNMSSRVSDFFSSQNPIVFKFKKARQLKQVRQRLDALAEEKNKFHLTERNGDLEIYDREWRLTSSLVNESEIFGRNEDKEKIINELFTGSTDVSDLSICAIYGMGGLGKTTLAQLVFNDERVNSAFDPRIWVCVSDDFEVRRLTTAIIESIDGKKPKIQGLDLLQRELQKKLRGKRFLLVLDDVWSERSDKWDSLKMPLMVGAKGSMVVITTRIETVAEGIAGDRIHRLGYLSKDDSWLLFKQRSFLRESEAEYVKLEKIGKRIVQKCGGVPLAVKAIAGMLRSKRRERDWLSVEESEIWELRDDGSGILSALKLSYDSLPSYLRQCFGFCSIFPKDSEMNKSYLIELWLAIGFVLPRGQRELRETGDEIFNELSWRSFFQEVTEDKNGTVTCKMHDLIHDLAMSITRSECYMFDNKNSVESPEKIRHLHIPSQSMPPEKMDDFVNSCSSVRSFISHDIDLTPANFSSLKRVRALHCGMFSIPKSLGKMIHLRYLNIAHFKGATIPKSIGDLVLLIYLNLSESSIERLPRSISCLQSLQIMNLSRCDRLRELPQGMQHMTSLKCVDISNCKSLERTPPGIGHLTQLVELSNFIVKKDDGCGIGELKELDLGKRLCIEELDNVTGSTEAKSANLKRKQNLRSLKLIWGKHAGKFPDNEEDVLSSLQPHSNLEDLEIRYYQGLRLPDWMIGLPNLVSVKLDQCKRCTHLPPLGELPSLKHLEIWEMDSVKCISSEFYGNRVNPFPSLERLCFHSMPILEEWKTVEGRGNFPRLRTATFWECPKLIELPTFPTLNCLQINTFEGDDKLGSLQIDDDSSWTIVPNGLLQNQTHVEKLTMGSLPDLKSLSNQLDNLSMLRHLKIFGCNKLEDIPEAVQNLNSLESLFLELCESLVLFPVNGLHGLTSLRRLNIRWCKRFAYLSDGIMHLTQLEDLILVGCPMLNSLPSEIQHLSALQTLAICCCDVLTSVPNQIGYLTSLFELDITECPMLNSLPAEIQHLSALQKLTISRCDGLTSVPNQIEYLTSLSELHIYGFPMLNSLPAEIQHLSALQKLSISYCDRLTSVPSQIGYLTSLSELYIIRCPMLNSLPTEIQHLSALQKLSISYCDRLTSVPSQIGYLTSLSELYIIRCPMLNSLPTEIQHLSALQKLSIICCDGLTSVPNQIEHLTSLSELKIKSCPNLMSLPQGLRSLTALKKLRIWGCQHLEKRCKKEEGEDWPNIAHIPSIQIIPCGEEQWYF